MSFCALLNNFIFILSDDNTDEKPQITESACKHYLPIKVVDIGLSHISQNSPAKQSQVKYGQIQQHEKRDSQEGTPENMLFTL